MDFIIALSYHHFKLIIVSFNKQILNKLMVYFLNQKLKKKI